MVVVQFRKGNKRIKYASIREASEKTGIPHITLYHRVYTCGWTMAEACKAPVRSYKRKRKAA